MRIAADDNKSKNKCNVKCKVEDHRSSLNGKAQDINDNNEKMRAVIQFEFVL
jgi:hypothetical protein